MVITYLLGSIVTIEAITIDNRPTITKPCVKNDVITIIIEFTINLIIKRVKLLMVPFFIFILHK